MPIFFSFFVLTLFLFSCDHSFGDENATGEQTASSSNTSVEMATNVKFLNISLAESIVYALRNNFDIEISRLDTQVKDFDITVEKSAFDPVLNLSGSIDNSEVPTANILTTGLEETTVITPFTHEGKTADAIIQSKLMTGANVSMEYNVFKSFIDPSPFTLLNPSYSSFIEVKLTQPLLKGGGLFYNRSPIFIARNNKKISFAQFKNTAMEISDEVQIAYWSLIKAIEDLKVARKSLELAEDLLRKNKIEVETGTLAPIEIIDAESGVAARIERIISLENAVKDREDELKKIMNFAGDGIISDVTVVPRDKPVFESKRPELKEAIKIAMEKRPELYELQLEYENTEIERKQRKNELYPALDFTGGIRYSGLGNKVSAANDSTFSEDFQGEFFMLTLEVPIGNRAARSEYNKSKLEKRQARLNISKKELDIVIEVREAVRAVLSNNKLVLATKKARELAEERLVVEEKKYRVGRSTNLEILRAQEFLTIQAALEIKAVIDHKISLGNLEKAKGTILDVYNIQLEEETTDGKLKIE
ncbi:MAG: TolC family protein [Candidatus Brocadiaceae bacterium]|nr:TolC family protein [Candidatus Brocadiaceae bacterium]